jgi:hypothetical protein
MRRIPPLPWLPNALLGLLTLACFGGPFALLIIRGGPSGDWPPDRIVEWVVLALVFTSTAVLFVACVTVMWWYPWPGQGKEPPER